MTLASPKANLLKAIYHEGPSHVPFAGEGAYRLVDHASFPYAVQTAQRRAVPDIDPLAQEGKMR